MGIYGEGGFKLLKDKLDFSFGYFWPWSLDAGAQQQIVLANDEFHARLVIKKGLIPYRRPGGSDHLRQARDRELDREQQLPVPRPEHAASAARSTSRFPRPRTSIWR